MAQYAYHILVTSEIAIFLFYANYGYNPRTHWQTEAKVQNGWSQNYVNWVCSVYELCENLQKLDDRIVRYWNRGNKEPPKYEVGDLVILKGTNPKTRTLSKKFDNKLQRQFQVENIRETKLSPGILVLVSLNSNIVYGALAELAVLRDTP
jgi:hypothetical protein